MGISVEPSISEVQGNYYGSFTFANRPTASNYAAGSLIRITDIGVSGVGSIWVSTGTNWAPENGMVLMYQSAVAVTCPNDTNENTLFSMNIPGGLLGSSGSLRVQAHFSYTASTNTKRHRVKLGSTAFANVTNAVAGNIGTQTLLVISNVSATSQKGFNSGSTNHFGTTTGAIVTGSENTNSDISFSITGQKDAAAVSANDALVLERCIVELLRFE